MSPQNAMAERVGVLDAAALIQDLSRAGFIIVGKDAIAMAQREAVAQEREDRAEPVPSRRYVVGNPFKANSANDGEDRNAG